MPDGRGRTVITREAQKVLSSRLREAGRRGVYRRAVKVAAVVGTVLTLINQYDLIAQGRVDLAKAMLTYVVPFCVSTWSALTAISSES
jgi:hypothetical protein